MTDHDRWKAVANQPPPWIARLRIMASFIEPHSRVLDVGSGSGSLRDMLPEGCEYTAIDCIASRPDVIVCDLELDTPPQIPSASYTVAVLSGVLEHLIDPKQCLLLASTWAHKVIFSYATTELCRPREYPNRKSNLTSSDIDSLLVTLGLSTSVRTRWKRQSIYVAERKH